jgi:hypothetical protein
LGPNGGMNHVRDLDGVLISSTQRESKWPSVWMPSDLDVSWCAPLGFEPRTCGLRVSSELFQTVPDRLATWGFSR